MAVDTSYPRPHMQPIRRLMGVARASNGRGKRAWGRSCQLRAVLHCANWSVSWWEASRLNYRYITNPLHVQIASYNFFSFESWTLNKRKNAGQNGYTQTHKCTVYIHFRMYANKKIFFRYWVSNHLCVCVWMCVFNKYVYIHERASARICVSVCFSRTLTLSAMFYHTHSQTWVGTHRGPLFTSGHRLILLFSGLPFALSATGSAQFSAPRWDWLHLPFPSADPSSEPMTTYSTAWRSRMATDRHHQVALSGRARGHPSPWGWIRHSAMTPSPPPPIMLGTLLRGWVFSCLSTHRSQCIATRPPHEPDTTRVYRLHTMMWCRGLATHHDKNLTGGGGRHMG